MAYGVTGMFEQNLKPKRPQLKDHELLFAVREPFQEHQDTNRNNMQESFKIKTI
jgi:hypothetical protein